MNYPSIRFGKCRGALKEKYDNQQAASPDADPKPHPLMNRPAPSGEDSGHIETLDVLMEVCE